MTEAEWLACTDPEKMLEFEKQLPSGSVRKQRLFACACCRQAGDLIADGRCREAFEVAERFADNLGDADDIVLAFQVTQEIADEQRKAHGDVAALAAELANVACEESSEIAYYAWLFLFDLTPEDIRPLRQSWGKQVVHCIWGPLPFRPLPPKRCKRRWEQERNRWLAWNDGTVIKLAQAIYEDRAFDRLPILADALEESGCNNTDILNHCRSEGPHVRGCWVLDLLLGQE